MSAPSFPTTRLSRPLSLARRPWLIGLWALCLIVFFIFEYAFVVPFNTLWVNWTPQGQAVIGLEVPRPAEVDPAAPWPQEGDVLQAIDGIPVRYSDLHIRFGPAAANHSYELRRGDAVFTVLLPSGAPTPRELLNLLMPGILAFEAWLLGFIIVLLARKTDNGAWLAGCVMLGLGIAVAAAPAGGAGVPGGRLAYGVLSPIMSIGYIEMATLAGAHARRGHAVFRILYGLAGALATAAMFEILILNPSSTWQAVIGIRLESLALALLSLSFLAAPAILAVRAARQAPGYARRQMAILLFGAGVAILPFILLSALPQAIAGTTLVPLEITLPLLGAIPAAYAYVIYRHRFLKLDLFASRSLLLLVTGLIVAVVFFTGQRIAQATPAMASISPIVGLVSLLAAFGVVLQANPRIKPAIGFMLFGPDRHFDQAVQSITDELGDNPQMPTLTRLLSKKVPAVLDVRDAAVFLPNPGDGWMLAHSTVHGLEPVADQALLVGLVGIVLHQSSPEHPLFQVLPWARLAIPLRIKGKTTGVLVLGSKLADAPFNSKEVVFVQQVAGAAAVAHQFIGLVETQQHVAAERLRVQSQERMRLANRLHDMPLQRSHSIVQNLDQIINAEPERDGLGDRLRAQREEVRRLARELRDICAGLRPPIMSQGLSMTLVDVVNNFESNNPDIAVHARLDVDTEPAISEQALDAAYHVVTEALNNVRRHSGATKVQVALEAVPGGLHIRVVDNGRGTQLTTASQADLLRNRHFGITGMHEWATMAGGQLNMQDASPHGTLVELHIPLNDNHANGHDE